MTSMLVSADSNERRYRVAVNNASNCAELVSDLSYLEGLPGGILTFDFSHMAGPLSLEIREDYLPGSFGYQPTLNLLEVTAVIIDYMNRSAICPHQVEVVLPSCASRVGRFLQDMELAAILVGAGLRIVEVAPLTRELGEDDTRRQNLVPITSIVVTNTGPDFVAVARVRRNIERTFRKVLAAQPTLAQAFTSVISEAVDNLIEFGHGGLIGGLYYPRAGEVEVTLVNRYGGFGGNNPDEELEALVSACEGTTQRLVGGGNGIKELSEMAAACFGTVRFCNGSASLRLSPDGSLVAATAETGLPTPGARVTLVLQLLPSSDGADTPALTQYRVVLAASLDNYLRTHSKIPI